MIDGRIGIDVCVFFVYDKLILVTFDIASLMHVWTCLTALGHFIKWIKSSVNSGVLSGGHTKRVRRRLESVQKHQESSVSTRNSMAFSSFAHRHTETALYKQLPSSQRTRTLCSCRGASEPWAVSGCFS